MEWKKVKLKDVCDLLNGYAFKSQNYVEEGIRVIRITNVQKGYVIDSNPKFYLNDSKIKDYKLFENDILISLTGNVGRVALLEKKYLPAILNQRVGCLRVKNNDVINLKYLYWILNRETFERDCLNNSKGVAQKNLSTNWLKNLKIPLPPTDIQIKIANVLDRAQELIDNRKAQIEKYDELLQSVFMDMFGDPVTNPKGWEKEKLEKYTDIVRGGSPRPIQKYLGGNIPWIKIGDGTKGESIYLSKTKEHIIEDGVKKSRLIKKGGLIFANCGVSLGFARILKFDGCIHDGWLAFQNISNEFNKIFLLKLLNHYTDFFRKTAPDGTQPNLNIGIMKVFQVIIPPIYLQNKFVEIVEKGELEKKNLEKSLVELKNNFNSIMQRAFRGELF